MKPDITSELIFADDVLLAKSEDDLQNNINCCNDKVGKGNMQISLRQKKYDIE
jgi:hypothetical protein